MSRRPIRQAQAGFTIIEVAVASFVMAFGIATSIIVMQSGFKQIDVARGTTLASQIIQSEIERVRLMNWTMVNNLPATQTFNGTEYFGDNASAEKYEVTRLVADDDDRADVKNITVRVRWQTYDGRWQQRSFSAIYAHNGLYDYYYTLARP